MSEAQAKERAKRIIKVLRQFAILSYVNGLEHTKRWTAASVSVNIQVVTEEGVTSLWRFRLVEDEF